MLPQEKLVLVVAALQRAAPREWAAFKEEFDTHVRRQADICVAVDKDVGIAQGNARQAVYLKAVFDDAGKRADRINKQPPK